MSRSGWCGREDAFIFLSVDLQQVYILTGLRLGGVAGAGYLRGHVTKLQLFFKQQFSQNYDTYPVEFTTPPGNHNKMFTFHLEPPIRARYVLLGVTEYDEHPCMRFDMQGCIAPLSAAYEVPRNLLVGWNSSVPECKDNEPPVFSDCPALPVFVDLDDNGQLQPATYTIPTASDNSGSVAWTRVIPTDFRPPHFISKDTDVTYTAFDMAGNSATCVVQLRLPDRQGPVVVCPQSYVIEADDRVGSFPVVFNETTVDVRIQDVSNITEVRNILIQFHKIKTSDLID